MSASVVPSDVDGDRIRLIDQFEPVVRAGSDSNPSITTRQVVVIDPVTQGEQHRVEVDPTPGNGPDQLSQDELFDLLSNARRRYVLEYLSQVDGTADFERLTETVAAWENDTTVDRIEEADRKRVYVSLYQTHLPRLESSGVVEFDQERGIVEAGAHAVELARLIRDDEDDTDATRWPLVYGAVGIVGLAVLGAAAADVGPFAAVADVVIGGVAVVALLVVSAAHHLTVGREESIGTVDLEARRG